MESLSRRKDMMIAALWANSNYDDDKGTRKNAIDEIERNYEEAVAALNAGTHQQEAFDQADEDNPFIQAAKRGVEKLDKPISQGGTVQEVIDDMTKDIDQ